MVLEEVTINDPKGLRCIIDERLSILSNFKQSVMKLAQTNYYFQQIDSIIHIRFRNNIKLRILEAGSYITKLLFVQVAQFQTLF